jgi:hypothetical protein
VKGGHQSGHLTAIQAKGTVQEPTIDLQLVKLATMDGQTLDFKLKTVVES